jgi:hypothetical protein
VAALILGFWFATPDDMRAAGPPELERASLIASTSNPSLVTELILDSCGMALRGCGLLNGRAVLMPSTPSPYPQVISRRLASFRVVKFHVSAAHDHFWGGFDSRQLHQYLCT